METADVVWMPRKAVVSWACARAAVVETPPESVRLDIRDFGAAGDGRRDDTGSIQAAVARCAEGGTVEVPAGRYRVSSLWLKDGVSLHLAQGAELLAVYDREGRALLPPSQARTDGGAPYPLGTWEGESCAMSAAVVNAVGVRDACVYGPGTVDGQATADTWWHDPKRIRAAARPRLVFLEGCERVALVGTLRDSPSWNVHPVLCRDARFLCLALKSPADSPPTPTGSTPRAAPACWSRGASSPWATTAWPSRAASSPWSARCALPARPCA